MLDITSLARSVMALGGDQRRAEAERRRTAELCAENADALAEFERTYARGFADVETASVIGGRSRAQADAGRDHAVPRSLEELCDRIAGGLAARTATVTVDLDADEVVSVRHGACAPCVRHLPEAVASDPVTVEDVNALATVPPEARPQLAVGGTVRDIDADSGETLVSLLARLRDEREAKRRRGLYGQFRQGLDILDVDAWLWGMLGRNPDSIENWLPALAIAIHETEAPLRIPRTRIAIVPPEVLQMTRIDYGRLSAATRHVVNLWSEAAFDLTPADDLFVRTGTASSKFDFRNARVRGEELPELGEYLLYVHSQQVEAAGPLSSRPTYGMGTTRAWAVRDFVEAESPFGHIYHGMPLRPELRVFVDADAGEIIGVSDYWRRDVMEARLGEAEDGHILHDLVAYRAAADALERACAEARPRAVAAVRQMLPALDLSSTWSIDVMCEGDDLWAIDMAQAARSALADVCDPARIAPPAERWLPGVAL